MKAGKEGVARGLAPRCRGPACLLPQTRPQESLGGAAARSLWPLLLSHNHPSRPPSWGSERATNCLSNRQPLVVPDWLAHSCRSAPPLVSLRVHWRAGSSRPSQVSDKTGSAAGETLTPQKNQCGVRGIRVLGILWVEGLEDPGNQRLS